MEPRLPQFDADGLDARERQLSAARDTYKYAYDYPEGLATAAALPATEEFSDPFKMQIYQLVVAEKTNLASIDVDGSPKGADTAPKTVAAGTLDDYRKLWATRPLPALASNWQDDAVFAQQRVAGANPTVIERVQHMPDHFPVTEAAYARAIAGDSLEAAITEGRLYLADYAALAGVPAGTYGTIPKYSYAPMALFAVPPGGSSLMPAAIQCGQSPDAGPVFGPADGWRWTMARTVVQTADVAHQEAVEHLGKCHLVSDAIVLAARRNLASVHPLMVLFAPHFQFTMAINWMARHELIAPGGRVEQIFTTSLPGFLDAVSGVVSGYDLQQEMFPKRIAARGVGHTGALADYPYRDDGQLIWDALSGLCADYLGVYYPTDDDVQSDHELQSFLAELGSSGGGRIGGVGNIDTRAALAELATHVLFMATAQHSAVNYAQLPAYGYPPAAPASLYAAAPTHATPNTEASLLAMLPPLDQALGQSDLFYQLSNVLFVNFGKYDDGAFTDGRVRPALDRFTAALANAEKTIGERNAKRALPYDILLPSRIGGSIHI